MSIVTVTASSLLSAGSELYRHCAPCELFFMTFASLSKRMLLILTYWQTDLPRNFPNGKKDDYLCLAWNSFHKYPWTTQIHPTLHTAQLMKCLKIRLMQLHISYLVLIITFFLYFYYLYKLTCFEIRSKLIIIINHITSLLN